MKVNQPEVHSVTVSHCRAKYASPTKMYSCHIQQTVFADSSANL